MSMVQVTRVYRAACLYLCVEYTLTWTNVHTGDVMLSPGSLLSQEWYSSTTGKAVLSSLMTRNLLKRKPFGISIFLIGLPHFKKIAYLWNKLFVHFTSREVREARPTVGFRWCRSYVWRETEINHTKSTSPNHRSLGKQREILHIQQLCS